MLEENLRRFSSGISSFRSQKNNRTSSSRQHDESISIFSVKEAKKLLRVLRYNKVPKLHSVSDWEKLLENLRKETAFESPIAKIHLQCSNIFRSRLDDIEENVPLNFEAKLEVYKDWVNVLIKFNENIFEDFQTLENALFELQRASRAYAYLSNSRRDLSTLIKLISLPIKRRRWSLIGIEFNTLHITDVMGLNEKKNHDKEILRQLERGELSVDRAQLKNIPLSLFKKFIHVDSNSN